MVADRSRADPDRVLILLAQEAVSERTVRKGDWMAGRATEETERTVNTEETKKRSINPYLT